MKLKTILYILAFIFDLVVYLIFMPALNIQSLASWYFVLFALIPFVVIWFTVGNINAIKEKRFKDYFTKKGAFLLKTIIVVAIAVFLATFIGLPLTGGLNAYRNRIDVPESSSFDEVDEFDATQVQIIDKNVAMSLADRVFGEMGADTVSQYDISSNYSSVVVNNTMYRITPVEYSGFIKWLSTASSGTPGFISVNVTTGDTQFHRVEEGLKYTENACLLHNLYRKLRLSYPTYVFGNTKFEVDDDWKPYWVSQVYKYSFIGKAVDVKGVVVTDPTNGKMAYYDVEEVPSWVDNVYDAPLISDQYDAYGEYINGLFNFSQKGITAVTDDYAYLQKNGHLWMYTGVTSVGQDESNVGFIYVDLQNKDVIYINSAGAEEYSARASAEGAVQEKGYTSVFPTMVNVEGSPVYFMGLKDNAGLIKAYAFVDYKNYQKVGIGDTVSEALKNFTGKSIISNDDVTQLEIQVKDIQSAVVEGYTIYYIQTISDDIYSCSIEISEKLPFVKTGDVINVGVIAKNIVKIY